MRARVIHGFFSGGRDSALASYIAYRTAKARDWGFRLIFIDTTIAIPDTVDYVHMYAEWLGAELIVIKPKHGFSELAPKYSWPLLYHNRWCYYALKSGPTVEYLQRNYKSNDVVVMDMQNQNETESQNENEVEKRTVIYLTTDEVVDLLIEWAEVYKLPEWVQKMMEDIQARSFMNKPVTEEEKISFIAAAAYNMPNDSPLKDMVLRFLKYYNSDWVICEEA